MCTNRTNMAHAAQHNMAHGAHSVCSADRPECHAPSGFSVKDYSGKPASNGITPRDRQRATILAFWESRGIAEWRKGGANGGGAWWAIDVVSGEWMPLAQQGEDARANRIEFSHIRSNANGGAWCACNVVPENGATNLARGDKDLPLDELPGWMLDTLSKWHGHFIANVARKASLARL